MVRLTQKHDFFEYVLPCQNIVGDNQATEISLVETEYTCKKHIIGEAIKEFGELEDVLEKYGIDNLDDFIKEYSSRNIKLANDNYDLEQELAELKQKAIVPKFRTYQPIFYITQYYTSTKGNPEYDIISDKYYVAENENEIILGWNYAKDFNQRKYYYVRKDWVFATKEEAIALGKEAIADKLTGNIIKEIYVPKKIINIVMK